MAAASSSNSTKDAGAADDDWIAREITTTLHVLSLQSNPLKESPEAAVLAMPVGGGSGGGGGGGGGVSIELQRLEWLPDARTLRLSAFPEPGLTASGSSSSNGSSGGGGGGLTRAQQLLLAAPITLELFFPESPADPPLCFGSTGGCGRRRWWLWRDLVDGAYDGSVPPQQKQTRPPWWRSA